MGTEQEPIQGMPPTCRECGGVIDDPLRADAVPGVAYDVPCPHCGKVAMRLLPFDDDPSRGALQLEPGEEGRIATDAGPLD